MNRDAAGELGTTEADYWIYCADDSCPEYQQMQWAPDVHGYIAWVNRVLWGVLFALTFAAGFLVATILNGVR